MKKSEVPTCSKQHVLGGSPPPKRGSEFRCCPGLNNLMWFKSQPSRISNEYGTNAWSRISNTLQIDSSNRCEWQVADVFSSFEQRALAQSRFFPSKSTLCHESCGNMITHGSCRSCHGIADAVRGLVFWLFKRFPLAKHTNWGLSLTIPDT